MYFVEVILPIPIKNTFTYSVNKDEALFLKKGMRVAVPFGKSKIYTGIVFKVHQTKPAGYEVKSIDQILEETPSITPIQLEHWQWMAQYYMCNLGEVIKAGLPSILLLESETIITLNKQTNVEEHLLDQEAFLIFKTLQNSNALAINDIRNLLEKKNVLGVLQELVNKNIINIQENLFDKYQPKTKRYVKLASKFKDENLLQQLFEDLNKAKKQKKALLQFYMLKNEHPHVETTLLQKKAQISSTIIKALIDKQIFIEYFLQVDRYEFEGKQAQFLKALTPAQAQCFKDIQQQFLEKDIVLLHGVTSSGKTEVYVKWIETLLHSGKQILFMLPEIALTTQLITRLQKYFGEKIAIYHSKSTNAERVEVWLQVLNKEAKAQIVVGARSALFLPFQDLGAIIIDEEHEPSYKQHQPNPRYHARDTALVLGKYHQAKVLLGSATPSIETYHNTTIGKYGKVELKQRYGNVLLPEIELIDFKEQLKMKKTVGHFSEPLRLAIEASLNEKQQIILFQNRRGFAPVVECTTCGNSPQCPNCDVSLTYHQYKNELRCHYCGYQMAMLVSCMACGSPTLDTKGFGTEQIEEELKQIFPKARVARMDQDTTKAKHAYAKLIEKMEHQEIDILVGTQMLAKGLDFRNVALVGVMNADLLLNFPDYRAHERCYQLLVQVAGRAGRTQKRGKVLIQTYNPYHQILQQVTTHNFTEMYLQQNEERIQYKYSPHYKLVKIILKHRTLYLLENASNWLAQSLKLALKENVLGPVPPPIPRIKNEYITHILIKIPKTQSLKKTKDYIQKVTTRFSALKEFARVKLIIDVDPY